MTRVICDQVLRTKLQNLSGQVEICDETGRILVFFIPWLRLIKPFTRKPSPRLPMRN